jgi:oxygen-independent coproporphyrinogen III oxidase
MFHNDTDAYHALMSLALDVVNNDTQQPLLDPRDLPAVEVPGLYVHIPFCFHKCHYCDFYSITRQTEERMGQFVARLLAEAALYSARPLPHAGAWLRPRTVFFGGGTPSLLPARLMRRLIEGLLQRFDFSNVKEWTIEANPATLTLEYAHMLRELGVDRLSFGAQSFKPTELATLERHHHPDDVPRSVQLARAAGFERINLDLIYGIPGQDLAAWADSLESAITLGTSHLSCYGLTYEPNTPMAVRKRLGHFQAVEEDVELAMLRHTRRRLAEAGLPAYEISNYARPGEECRHNLLYWTGGSYIGLGPSAASHVEGRRWRNRPHLGEWERAIDSGALPAADVEHLSPLQRAGELAMLLLRLTNGIEFADFIDRTGYDARLLYADQLQRFEKLGLIEVTHGHARLTDAGLPLADAIASEFLASSADST